MARPAGRPIGTHETTIADLREEFLDRCRGKNLSGRTIEWYEDRTRRFSDWCLDQGILQAKDLTADDLERFVLVLQRGPYKPQTVRGFAQIVKTLLEKEATRFAASLETTSTSRNRHGGWGPQGFCVVVRDHRFERDYEIASYCDYWGFIGALVDHRQCVSLKEVA